MDIFGLFPFYRLGCSKKGKMHKRPSILRMSRSKYQNRNIKWPAAVPHQKKTTHKLHSETFDVFSNLIHFAAKKYNNLLFIISLIHALKI